MSNGDHLVATPFSDQQKSTHRERHPSQGVHWGIRKSSEEEQQVQDPWRKCFTSKLARALVCKVSRLSAAFNVNRLNQVSNLIILNTYSGLKSLRLAASRNFLHTPRTGSTPVPLLLLTKSTWDVRSVSPVSVSTTEPRPEEEPRPSTPVKLLERTLDTALPSLRLSTLLELPSSSPQMVSPSPWVSAWLKKELWTWTVLPSPTSRSNRNEQRLHQASMFGEFNCHLWETLRLKSLTRESMHSRSSRGSCPA